MGLVGSRNFLTFHLPFEVRVTSLNSHSKGSLHIQRVGELLYIEIRFLNFFFAYHPRVEGDIFGSEKFWIFRPYIGFPSKLDFQKSSICSNKSHTYKEFFPHPVIKLTDFQFNVFTHLKLSDEIFFHPLF